MTRSWILIANSMRARLFAQEGSDALQEFADFTNPDGHYRNHGTYPDRLPRTQESSGNARHAIEPHTNQRDKSQQAFARQLCDVLEEGRVARRFDRLVLIATPRFLGLLHGRLSKSVARMVELEIRHDLTTLTPLQLESRLSTRAEASPDSSQPSV